MERRDFLKGALGGLALLATLKEANAYDFERKIKEYRDKYVPAAKEEGEGFLRLKNRNNPSMMEKKHVPAIIAPRVVGAGEWFEVKVKVGFMVTHPSTPKHWITKIYLLADGRKIAEVDYPVGGVAASEATFKIRLNQSTKLEAVENCNLHGTWISDPFEIKVI
ncbi:MAG: hypothetical protein GXO20_01810 [Thermodesulfobacteria bacterium]|nr:hypothetical protein [Thermodesulfobacteriota bacterium]